MTGLVRKATLLSVCGLFVAGAAMASVPSATNSSLGKVIHLVGATSGVLSTTVGDYTVTVRDIANNPIQNSSLVLDFTNCGTGDVRIASGQLEAGLTTDCPTKSVRALTNASGVFTFKVMGNSQNPAGGAVGLAVPCLRIFADGVLLDPQHAGTFAGVKAVLVAPYDESGTNGFTAADLPSFVGDLFHVPATYYARSDFDGNGLLSALDLSNQVGAFFAGSWNATAAVCP
jgi:hypothetical protein